jgi:RNA polymerase sigma factor (sigma-70 family)
MEGRKWMQDGASGVLDQFRQGKPEAFEILFRQHQRAVYRWLLQIVRNPSAAEDLMVETFWRIYQAHARFDPRRSFEAWSRTIATHAALDWMKAQHPETELTVDLAAMETGDPGVNAEIRRATAIAFARLAPKLRIAAVLAVVEERPHKEVAEALGISVVAVKVRVHRALHLLRRDLEKQGIMP